MIGRRCVRTNPAMELTRGLPRLVHRDGRFEIRDIPNPRYARQSEPALVSGRRHTRSRLRQRQGLPVRKRETLCVNLRPIDIQQKWTSRDGRRCAKLAMSRRASSSTEMALASSGMPASTSSTERGDGGAPSPEDPSLSEDPVELPPARDFNQPLVGVLGECTRAAAAC